MERKNGKSILAAIHNAQFDMIDQWVNNRFIINNFKNMSFIYIMKSYCVKQKKHTECVEPSGYKKAKMVDLCSFVLVLNVEFKKIRFVKNQEN